MRGRCDRLRVLGGLVRRRRRRVGRCSRRAALGRIRLVGARGRRRVGYHGLAKLDRPPAHSLEALGVRVLRLGRWRVASGELEGGAGALEPIDLVVDAEVRAEMELPCQRRDIAARRTQS